MQDQLHCWHSLGSPLHVQASAGHCGMVPSEALLRPQASSMHGMHQQFSCGCGQHRRWWVQQAVATESPCPGALPSKTGQLRCALRQPHHPAPLRFPMPWFSNSCRDAVLRLAGLYFQEASALASPTRSRSSHPALHMARPNGSPVETPHSSTAPAHQASLGQPRLCVFPQPRVRDGRPC